MSKKPRKYNKQTFVPLQKQPKIDLILGAHKHEHNHQHQLNISPFLPASELERINYLNPEFAKKIFDLTEKQIDADIENNKAKIILEQKEQDLRDKEITGEVEYKKRGQNYGLIVLLFLGIVTLGLVYLEAFKTAAAFATITIVGSTTAFTGFTKYLPKSKPKKPL